MKKASRLLAGVPAALCLTGCLASKGDIRLLQDELRATREAVARSDSAHKRETDSLAAALAALASAQTKGDQALRQTQQQAQQQTDTKLSALSTRLQNLEITTNEKFKSLNEDVTQVQELARQNVRGVTAAKALAEQAAANVPVAGSPPGDTAGRAPAVSAAPGPATLFQNGNSSILQGSCRAARRSYEELLKDYPNDPLAPEAQERIAESFVACAEGANPAAADSVYSLVTAKYPKSEAAATALWKRADAQSKAGKADVARALLQRVVCEYPKSTVYQMALERLGTGKAACK